MASRIWPLKNIAFYPSPQYIRYLYGPKSIPKVLTVAPHSLSVLVGGVGVITTTPSRTSASIVVPVLSPPTNVAASSDTASYAATVSLYVWVLPVPSRNLMTAAPMSLYVLLGWGVGVVTWAPSRTPESAVSVCPGGEGWCYDQVPFDTPNSSVISVLPVKSNSPCGFQPKCPPWDPRPTIHACSAMILAATEIPPRSLSKLRKRPSA